MTLSISSDKPTEILQRIALFVGDPVKTEPLSTSFKNANRAALYRYLFKKYEKNKELAFYCNVAKTKYEKIKMTQEEWVMAIVKEVYTRVIENGLSLLTGEKFLFNNTPYFVWEGKMIPCSSRLSPVRLGKIAKDFAPYLDKKAMDLIIVFQKIAMQSLTAQKIILNLVIKDLTREELLKIAEKISTWMVDNPQSYAKNLRKDGTDYTTAWKWFKKTKKIRKLKLKMSDPSILFFPKEISHLTTLQKLKLPGNQLETLPDSFGNLTNLHTLDLRANMLRTLPDNFKNLKKIEKINLAKNRFNTLPDCFEKFTYLNTMSLHNNGLQYLPESFEYLMHLKFLNLANNLLKTLPESFGKLKNLEKLILSDNEIESLPNSFGNLIRLNFLHLNSNQLETLPESFKNLKQLKEFKIAFNRLRSLPCSFGKFKNLEVLSLIHNDLKTLPASFGNLAKLRFLYLDNNPLEYIPRSILQSSNPAIRNHSVLRHTPTSQENL